MKNMLLTNPALQFRVSSNVANRTGRPTVPVLLLPRNSYSTQLALKPQTVILTK